MPTQTIFDEATVELMGYNELIEYAANSLNYDGPITLQNHISMVCRGNAYDPISSLTTEEQWAQQIINELRENGFEVQYNGNNVWTGTVFPENIQIGATNPVNSNLSTVSRGNVRSWWGGLNEFGQTGLKTWVPQRLPVSGGLGSKAMYFLGSIGSGVAAASTGIWLGKTFDSALYNAIPNFWDSIGWGTLNPETWGMLIEGDNSPFAGMLNFILGIDGTNGNAQAYISEDMLAYLAYGLNMTGMFVPPTTYGTTKDTLPIDYRVPFITYPFTFGSFTSGSWTRQGYEQWPDSYYITNANSDVFSLWLYNTNSHYLYIYTASKQSFTTVYGNASSVTLNGKTFYVNVMADTTSQVKSNFSFMHTDTTVNGATDMASITKIGYAMLFESDYESTGIDGIGTQEGATVPDTTGWDDLSNVLPSLQQQYPDAFQNPMIWNSDTPYDDTAGNQTRYIPVPFPIANSAADTQPISGTQTQTNTSLNTTPDEIKDWITKAIQQTTTQPATPPANPTDTGTGDTPIPTAPTGSASALWSVYHPTQGQVNSFGAWLWGSPFLTNIGKLFQNPIEGVISLHKVFVTPIDSGTGNIVVGTLDSGVSSATVNNQYVEVDCGSVSLNEDFGNVFDYDPYTKVALYLPFVGIVPLNVADVMRSTINVKYGVDLFTGACIAMVSVSRDGNDATLYQYSGNCAVHYPLSNVQQSQLLNGLITVAAGVGAIVATGGAAAPAAATGIASGAMSALQSNVGRSGGFSANAGAMGIKVPYLIIERPQTKVAETFPQLIGYPTNYSIKLGDCSNNVVVKHVHVEGINATKTELEQIESLLHSGVLI